MASSSATPRLAIPFSYQLMPKSAIPAQLSSAKRLAYTTGVLIHPGYSFSIGFHANTFASSRPSPSGLACQASLSEDVALPSWISLDRKTLTFDGVAPPKPMSANITVACHQPGSAAFTSDWFLLQVGRHALEIVGSIEPLEMMESNPVQYDGSAIARNVAVDGKFERPEANNVVVDTSAFGWLKWNGYVGITLELDISNTF